MPFSPVIKSKMFIKCARICCLCYKQCGTNIEAAHIIDESKGGSNDEDNGIPVCFDCHEEIGSYNDKHPKGNKFRPEELYARRDKIYEIVDSGFLQAQIITQRLQVQNPSVLNDITVPPNIYKPTKEVLSLLKQVERNPESLPLKFSMLGNQEQAYIIDTLVDETEDDTNNLQAIYSIISHKQYDKNKGLIIFEQLLRKATILYDLGQIKTFLADVPMNLFLESDEGLRIPFFTDLIEILERNQFGEVNKITGSVVRVQEAIPDELKGRYVKALLGLTTSHAWDAAPTARRIINQIPDSVVKHVFPLIDDDYIFWNRDRGLKEFLQNYQRLWPDDQKQIFNDLVNLNMHEFFEKHPNKWWR